VVSIFGKLKSVSIRRISEFLLAALVDMGEQASGLTTPEIVRATYSCPLCQRPFEKREHSFSLCNYGPRASFKLESTFKRHGYYCRSRPADQRKSRKRACAACIISKVRCDVQTPSCSKCQLRGLSCVYAGLRTAANSQDGTAVNLRPGDFQPADQTTVIVHDDQTTASNISQTVGFLANQGNNVFDWDMLNMTNFDPSLPQESAELYDQWDVARFTSASTDPVDTFSSLKGFNFQAPPHYPSTSSSTSQTLSALGQDSNSNPSISYIISSYHSIRSFAPRTMTRGKSQGGEVLLMQILKSFPKMMLRRETFPPFIHAHCTSADLVSNSSELIEPLANCMTVAQLFYSATGSSRKLVWRMIRMEIERVVQDVSVLLVSAIRPKLKA
jgi:hypothetical protein